MYERKFRLGEAAFALINLGVNVEKNKAILNEEGIFGTNSQIRSKINSIKGDYIFWDGKQKKNKKVEVKQSWFKMLSQAGTHKRMQLNPDMLLPEWIGILNEIKDGSRKN